MTWKMERKDVRDITDTRLPGETSTPISVSIPSDLAAPENGAEYYTGVDIFTLTRQQSHHKCRATGSHSTPPGPIRNLCTLAKFDTLHENLEVGRSRMSLPEI